MKQQIVQGKAFSVFPLSLASQPEDKLRKSQTTETSATRERNEGPRENLIEVPKKIKLLLLGKSEL